jgi:hypothetical protein
LNTQKKEFEHQLLHRASILAVKTDQLSWMEVKLLTDAILSFSALLFAEVIVLLEMEQSIFSKVIIPISMCLFHFQPI